MPDNRPPAPACQLEQGCSKIGYMNIRLTIRLGPFDVDHYLVACRQHYDQVLSFERPGLSELEAVTWPNPLLVQSEKSLSLHTP